MTQKEILKEAATKYSQGKYLPVQTFHAFLAGAEWADKTMIDKACEWLKSHGGFTLGFDGATVRDFLNFINK